MKPSVDPIAQSPLTDWHRRHGAHIDVCNGWRIAVRYPDESPARANALVDFAHCPTWELNGPRISETIADLCGGDVSVRSIHSGTAWQLYRLTTARAIVFGMPAGEMEGALDVTGGWVSLVLVGPDSERILNKVTAVDLRMVTLPVYGCCQGPIFGVNTLFGRFPDRFELHICGDSAEFLWEVLLDAGAEFGLKPVGVDFAGTRTEFNRDPKGSASASAGVHSHSKPPSGASALP
jgi:glycine cleavage system aminomethyltransferase T